MSDRWIELLRALLSDKHPEAFEAAQRYGQLVRQTIRALSFDERTIDAHAVSLRVLSGLIECHVQIPDPKRWVELRVASILQERETTALVSESGSANDAPDRFDWHACVRSLHGADPVAAAGAVDAITGLIIATLHSYAAYSQRSNWDDLVSDVFFTLIRQPDELDYPAAWIQRVTQNKLNDRYRKRAVMNRAHAQIADEQKHALTSLDRDRARGNPECQLALRDLRMQLAAARRALPRKLAVVIELLHPLSPNQRPLSRQQAADELGIPLDTLRSRLKRALALMSKQLERESHFPQLRPRPPSDEDYQ